MQDVRDRIRCKKLIAKVAPAETAVNMIQSGMSVGICSDLRPICNALERRIKEDKDFGIQIWSGVASLMADRTLGELGKIRRRIGQQTLLQTAINAKQVDYLNAKV